MLRRIAFAAASALALTAAANAADIYRAPDAGGYKDGPAYVALNWSGAYIGGHAGGAWDEFNIKDLDHRPFNQFGNSTSGLFGGATLGYNFQSGNFVFGAEIDAGVMDLSHTIANPLHPNTFSTIDAGFYGDITGRVGYAFDRTLIYGKGGFAVYDGSVSVNEIGVGTGSTSTLTGWTAGGGVEYKLSPAWSVKAEYLYFDFGTTRVHALGDSYDNTLTVQTVKAGLNYFIGRTYEPLK